MAQNTSNQPAVIDIKALLKEYRKHWWWFLAGAVVLTGLTFAYSKLTLDQYGVTATVLVSDDQQSMPSAAALIAKSGLDFGGMFGGTASVYNEMALMNSYSVCMKTVKEMGLNAYYIESRGILKKMPLSEERTPVRISCAASIPDTLTTDIIFKVRVGKDGKPTVKTKIGKRSYVKTEASAFPVTINTDFGTFTLDTTKWYRPGRKLSENIIYMSYSNAAQLLMEAVRVKQINKKADIIQVDMASPNALFARDIITNLIRFYNATGMEQQYTRTSETYRFLNERIDSITRSLSLLEENIAAYKKEHKMPDPVYTARLDATRYEKLYQLLRGAEVEFDVMTMVKGFISNPENRYSLIPQVGDSIGAVQAAISAYNDQLLKRMTLSTNARENNVAIKMIDDQLNMMRGNINTSLDKAIETYRYRLGQLRKRVSEAENKVTDIPVTELEYGNIARRQAIEEQLYLYLLQQREETSMKMSNIMPRGVVLDQPHVLMESIGLSRTKKLIIAFMLGLIIPATVLFVLVRRRETAAPAESES